MIPEFLIEMLRKQYGEELSKKIILNIKKYLGIVKDILLKM